MFILYWNKMKVKVLNNLATVPDRIRKGDAGLSLRSLENKILAPGDRYRFRLGVALQIDDNWVALTQWRSGHAINYGIDTLGNVIDSNYRWEISVILVNNGDKFFKVEEWDNIAQLVILPVWMSALEVVDDIELDTERGAMGFGSSDGWITP